MRVLMLFFIFCSWLFASVGSISAMSGAVEIKRSGDIINAKTGMLLEKKDQVFTKENSKAQITFKDKTVITIGAKSSFNIEEYFFDETSKAKPKFNVGLSSGAFKIITGKIGKIAKDRFSIKTKNATIGIRGTQILVDIQDDIEHIACIKGEIFVEVEDTILDIKEGLMTSIVRGDLPSAITPIDNTKFKQFSNILSLDSTLIKKISNVKLDTSIASYDQAKELKAKIATIKNDTQRIAALDLLDDELNKQLDSILEDKYYKITLPSTFQPSNSHELGVYTQNNIKQTSGGYLVDGVNYKTLEEAISMAKPVEVFQNNLVKNSSLDVIESFMGKKVEDEYVRWSGDKDTRKVALYEGASVGYFYDRATKEYKSIINNENNKIEMLFDFGNRFIVGNLRFDLDKNSNYSLDFLSNNGATSINPSGFFVEDFYQFDNTYNSFVIASLFTGRYFGDEADSLTAYYNVLSQIQDENDPNKSSNVVGVIAANKIDSIELTKHPIDSDEFLSWGYWADDESDLKMGGYIKQNAGVNLTDKEYISSMISSKVVANYTGSVEGTVHQQLDGVISHESMSNGEIDLNFDFGTQSIKGNINFDTPSDKWRLKVDKGDILLESFTLDHASVTSDSTQTPISFEGSGKFFGPQANAIGGGFSVVSSEAKTAIGVIQGKR